MLVTGFGCFDDFERNPSGDIAQDVDESIFSNIRVSGLRVAVDWQSSWAHFKSAVDRINPQVIICFGLAPEEQIRFETLAYNEAHPVNDINNQKPPELPAYRIEKYGPTIYSSTLPLTWLKEQLRISRSILMANEKYESIPDVIYSTDPGRYLCNYLFYKCMHHFKSKVACCGFIHLPAYSEDDLSKSYKQATSYLIGFLIIRFIANWLHTNSAYFSHKY